MLREKYYSESELLKIKTYKSDWGWEEKSCAWEEHQINPTDERWVSLCTNCLELFVRVQERVKGHTPLVQSRNLANEHLADNINTYAPKMARGIVAWLLYYTRWNSVVNMLCLASTASFEELLAAYKAECYARWRYIKAEYYKAYQDNNLTNEMARLDAEFIAERKRIEQEFIGEFVRQEWMEEAQYQRLVELANEYVLSLDKKESKPMEMEADGVELYPKLPIHWRLGELLAELKCIKDGRNQPIVRNSLTDDEFIRSIKQADTSFIKARLCQKAFIRQLAIEDAPKGWRDSCIRKGGITKLNDEANDTMDKVSKSVIKYCRK